jgi:hypothetical protein
MDASPALTDAAAGSAERDRLVAQHVAQVDRAGAGEAARQAYREGFARLRSGVALYPVAAGPPSAVFESAAKTVRDLGAACLPLGIAVAMHLYPVCVLQCMPVPLLSVARFQRALLLRAIRNRALILANAGSERTRGAEHLLVAIRDADGIRVHGTFEYMSLASVADLVLFKARLADGTGTVLCAAGLRGGSVHTSGWVFSGRMRLSDTTSVRFDGHHVPHGRYVLVTDDAVLGCTADYQRSWFHLFLADLYLARMERLWHVWRLPVPAEQVVSLNEVSQLRAYALRLLDEFSTGSPVEPLKQATGALKLRVSLMAQSTMAALRALEERMPDQCQPLRTDASELRYIKFQPTADEVILRSIGALPPS